MDFSAIFHKAKNAAVAAPWPKTLQSHEYDTPDLLIDVRSPIEYDKSHIPTACNVPLFTNEEREKVGTIHKHEGGDAAVTTGLGMVEAKIQKFGQALLDLLEDRDSVCVTCFRGRKRSSSVCFFISHLLPNLKIFRLEGGMKQYRTWVLAYKPRVRFLLITGRTGSGKTKILTQLRLQGEQTIDLERRARHRGSAFGLLGAERQPNCAQFQNDLVHAFRQLDPARLVWLEHEHTRIGSCHLPHALATYLLESPSLILCIHKNQTLRTKTILDEYASFDADSLVACVQKIKKKFGKQSVEACSGLIRQGRLGDAVPMLLDYYDKLYDAGLKKRLAQVKSGAPLKHVTFEDNEYADQAMHLRSEAKRHIGRAQRGRSGVMVVVIVLVAFFLAQLAKHFGFLKYL